jgi:hypothetical protein
MTTNKAIETIATNPATTRIAANAKFGPIDDT